MVYSRAVVIVTLDMSNGQYAFTDVSQFASLTNEGHAGMQLLCSGQRRAILIIFVTHYCSTTTDCTRIVSCR